MSDAFAPPSDIPEQDPHVMVAAVAQMAMAALSGLVIAFAILMAFLSLFIPTNPGDPPAAFSAGIMCCESSFAILPLVLYGLGGMGLMRGSKWGWAVALAGFGILLGGCTLPLGLYGMWALLRESQRRRFGWL